MGAAIMTALAFLAGFAAGLTAGLWRRWARKPARLALPVVRA